MGTTDTSMWDGSDLDAWIYCASGAAGDESLPQPTGKDFVASARRGGATTLVCPDPDDARETLRLYAAAVEYLTKRGAVRIGLSLDGMTAESARLAYLGARMGAYRFGRYRQSERPDPTIHVRAEEPLESAIPAFAAVADAQDHARDWVNTAPNDKPPEAMAAMFQDGAPKAIGYELIAGDALREMGAGGIVAVGSASTANGRGPAVLIGRYEGAGPEAPWLALVGKGITFDSGGLSIKPADGMFRMKGDMAGGAAAMAALRAIAQLGVQANVFAVAAIAENIIGGAGFRPGDVLRMLDGTHVEIISTDAEGRLVLADGVTIARQRGAAAVVDIATLTGANVVALGAFRAGLIANDRELAALVKDAAERASEPAWELPTDAPYRELLHSPVADLKNSGGRPGGVITGGLFVGHFAKGVPWVHLDIAGMAFDGSTGRGNGFGVALLVSVAERWAERER